MQRGKFLTWRDKELIEASNPIIVNLRNTDWLCTANLSESPLMSDIYRGGITVCEKKFAAPPQIIHSKEKESFVKAFMKKHLFKEDNELFNSHYLSLEKKWNQSLYGIFHDAIAKAITATHSNVSVEHESYQANLAMEGYEKKISLTANIKNILIKDTEQLDQNLQPETTCLPGEIMCTLTLESQGFKFESVMFSNPALLALSLSEKAPLNIKGLAEKARRQEEIQRHIKFEKFVKRYKKDNQSNRLNTSGRSMKNLLMNEKVTTIFEVSDYATMYPDSQTNKVIQSMLAPRCSPSFFSSTLCHDNNDPDPWHTMPTLYQRKP